MPALQEMSGAVCCSYTREVWRNDVNFAADKAPLYTDSSYVAGVDQFCETMWRS